MAAGFGPPLFFGPCSGYKIESPQGYKECCLSSVHSDRTILRHPEVQGRVLRGSLRSHLSMTRPCLEG